MPVADLHKPRGKFIATGMVAAMKLSLWTLFAWLQNAGMSPAAKIARGDPCVSRFELQDFSSQSPPDPAAVMVRRERASGSRSSITLVNGSDTVSIQSVSCDRVCNELVRAFEFFNDWEQQLLLGLLKKGSLQELLDIAHRVFRRPMFIKSDSNWAFAITGGYDGAVHPDWTRLQESVTTRRSSMDAVRVVSMDPQFNQTFQKRYPVIMESPLYGGYVLHSNVWLGERRVCEIIAIENGKPFNPGDTHLMHVFAGMVERYMAANQNLYLSSSGISALFVDLIKHHDCDGNSLKMAREAVGWTDGDDLAVITVGSHSKGETPVINVLREQLTGGLRFSCVFTYQGKVVCVSDVTRNGGRQSLVKQLAELIPADMFYWGMSYEFLALEELPVYYRQALAVMEKSIAKGRSWNTMYQVALDVIHDQLEKSVECQSLVHPDIRRLLSVDRKNGSHYLETMIEVLLCGANYTDTANRLGLHRNSLIYRISRIKEMIQTDLDDINNRRLLLFSFLMIRTEEEDQRASK